MVELSVVLKSCCWVFHEWPRFPASLVSGSILFDFFLPVQWSSTISGFVPFPANHANMKQRWWAENSSSVKQAIEFAAWHKIKNRDIFFSNWKRFTPSVCLWWLFTPTWYLIKPVEVWARGVAWLHPQCCEVSEFLLIIGRLLVTPISKGSQEAVQQQGGTVALETRTGNLFTRRNSPDFELDPEVCTLSAAFHQWVCLKTSRGRASPSPGRRRRPTADLADRPWNGVIIIKTCTPESPTHSVRFLSFSGCENHSEQWNLVELNESWQLVKPCGQSRVACLTTCQNQTKHLFKRRLLSAIGVVRLCPTKEG